MACKMVRIQQVRIRKRYMYYKDESQYLIHLTKPISTMPSHPLRCILTYLLLLGFFNCKAQDLSHVLPAWMPSAEIAPPNEAFFIEIDTIATDIGFLSDVDLTGYNTYRIYVRMSNPEDQLSAIYGGVGEPLEVNTTGSFFQSALGDVTPQGIYPAVWGTFPSNEFDSYITIGISEPAQSSAGEGTVALLESSDQLWTQAFEPENGDNGGSFVMSDTTGGAWYVLPSTVNGIAGTDQRVLIAQLTTNGELSGVVNAQIFLQGIQVNAVYVTLPLPNFGCFDPLACNFDPDATLDDGNCVYPETGLDCDGNCLFDTDGDGICNDDEIGGCTDPDAVNFNPAATEPNGLCIYEGCTNPLAENYDPDADVDDGTCIILGCIDTDTPACNYDPLANTDDGSCEYSCYGCTNPSACNYSPDAIVNDGSCEFDSCLGCTDPGALNYFPGATVDDGSCIFAGCTDPLAVNFNPIAELEDGSCLYPGCTYPNACNFDSLAVEDNGSCAFPLLPCSICSGDSILVLDADGDGVCDDNEIAGCTDPASCAFNPFATDDDGSCTYADGPCVLCMNGMAVIADLDGDGICNADEISGCTYPNACNYAPDATDDNGSCTFSEPGLDCDGNCLNDDDGDGICDNVDDCIGEFDVFGVCNGGCTVDLDNDGICDTEEIPGCTDGTACNFNGSATDEDGSCFFAIDGEDCDGNCLDDDDGDGICDNLDDCIGEIDVFGVCNGGCNADLDNDGICDDVDDCLGALDACGICNGPGAIFDCGCSNLPSGDCDCDGNQLDALGDCGGDCASDMDGDGICDDADDCVGNLDACGICNGPGEIYDCGCFIIPSGDCDCNGNQPDALGECGGDCPSDVDGDGICDTLEIPGCTDISACNYDGSATDDDGSCSFAADGFDCNGNCLNDSDGDGVCEADEIPGCTDESACNYDNYATDNDGTCTFAVEGLDCDGICLNDADADGICDGDEISGCTNGLACNYNPAATDDDGSCEMASCSGCTNESACNFDPGATLDNDSCLVPGPCEVCNGETDIISSDTDGDGVCDDDEVSGCTNPDADNFNPDASEDDGTCKIFGCTDPNADNYNSIATDEDGLCEYLCIGYSGCAYPDAENFDPNVDCDNGSCTFDCSTPTGSCVLDYDGNGIIGSADLVYFLGWYELECVE